MLNVDINAVDPGRSHTSKPSYIVNYKGEDWIRINYDTGASTTALPGYIAEDVPLTKVGEFVVASGTTIPNFGRVGFQVQDEKGVTRRLRGSVTDVHKALGSGGEMATNHDAYIWDSGGVLVSRGGKVAQGLYKEYKRLIRAHGNPGELRLHREGNLYNYYVM